MAYNLYTELVSNNVKPADAIKFCNMLESQNVESGDVVKDDNTFRFHSREAAVEEDVYTTMCFLHYPQDGPKNISGYHIGKGYFNTNFNLELDGKYTVCVYDRRNRTLFDTNSELWIITNEDNVYDPNEAEETRNLPHCYHYTSKDVDELKGRTRGTEDYFGSLDTVEISKFANIGIKPDSITIMPASFDPYAYVTNFIADRDYKKEAVPK